MWKEAVVRDIAVVLLLKLVLLYGLWMAFFSHPGERELSPQAVGQQLLGEPPTGVTAVSKSQQARGAQDGY